MLFFITIIALFNCIFAFEPSCSSCKHFIPNVRIFDDLGLCRMFKDVSIYNRKQYILPNYAIHCRQNEKLCGKSGFLYEAIDTPDKNQNDKINIDDENNIDDEIIINYENKSFENKILFEFDKLNNKYCGEVNEKEEIEQLEQEFTEIYQKIQKHNKKNIYNKNKDLYKLFKANKNV